MKDDTSRGQTQQLVQAAEESDVQTPNRALTGSDCAADAGHLNAEASILGEVETMPHSLNVPAVNNPFANRATAGYPGGKMQPSSYYQANEIKQIKRNRCGAD